MQTLNLGPEPAPLPFSRPTDGEQSGYKAAAKPAPAFRQGKRTFEIVSNTWEIQSEDRLVYCYDVSVGLEVMGNDETTRTFSVNKGPKDDASVTERNELIRESIRAGLKLHSILSSAGAHVSDGAALMYATESLDEALKPHGHLLRVPVELLSENAHKFIRNTSVKHVIVQVTGSKSFNIKDLSGMINRNRDQIDQSVKQFFEIVTSDYALNTHNYDFFTGGKLYRTDRKDNVGYGQERCSGLFKGMAVAGKEGATFAALNIDVTTGTFWREGSLETAIMELNGWRTKEDVEWDAYSIMRTNEMIKGLRVAYIPPGGGNSTFDFLVCSITATASRTTDGRTIAKVTTIEQQKYKNPDGTEDPVYNKFSNANIRLKTWPLIISRRSHPCTDDPTKFKVDIQYFPIELLSVKKNQRVPLKKQGAAPVRAIRVDERWDRTQSDLDALNLFGDTRTMLTNAVLKAFGIKLVRKPLGTTAITRKMPTVVFNKLGTTDKENALVSEKTSFRTGQLAFETPANISTLHVAFACKPRRFEADNFTNKLVEDAKRKGIRIDHVKSEVMPAGTLYKKLEAISELRKTDPKLKNLVFLYVEPDSGKNHDQLKLYERCFYIVTQHLKMETAEKMIINRPTMENFLLKLNVKGGGHNYNVEPEKFALPLWMEMQTMIMGYDVWHPTGQSRGERMTDQLAEPSVVGFSFNGGVNPDSFIGDYHFQEARKEKVHGTVLNARIKWMLLTFERSRKVLPPLIIVVRDGISDGQYTQGMDELEALREGAREYAASKDRSDALDKTPVPDYSPDFIFVVATKRHNKRMYTEAGRGHANMPAMSVVDDTITNPVLFEFFMQSHTPLQGMAKPTKYTVLKDDIGTTSDAMQALMGALCFEHQVSTNAISIPEPVYQSDEWAKRGAANMRMYKQIWGHNGQFKRGTTLESLTDKLSYWNSPLERVRVNA